MSKTTTIKSRIWIEHDNQMFLGEGRVKLLKAIHSSGSLNKACKEAGISYKKAWALLDSLNNSCPQPMVSKSIGGKNGGGTQLTPYGLKIIKFYDDLNKKCWAFLDEELKNMPLT
ncbi:MAG: winged helix-turn-helix domain-containing protein [Flavobacteriales bacterium]